MSEMISGDTPFGFASNFANYSSKQRGHDLAIYLTVKGRRTVGWVNDELVRKNRQLIPNWKIFLPEAYGERGAIPAMVLGPPIIAPPNSVCSQTYLSCGGFDSEAAAKSALAFVQTRFFRFLVSLRKISQHALRSTYSWVPQQSWDTIWTDQLLFQKYGITDDEVAFIESMIRPMGAGDD
jgi:site-specific DNA-methyltransferase (adenine-specific)